MRNPRFSVWARYATISGTFPAAARLWTTIIVRVFSSPYCLMDVKFLFQFSGSWRDRAGLLHFPMCKHSCRQLKLRHLYISVLSCCTAAIGFLTIILGVRCPGTPGCCVRALCLRLPYGLMLLNFASLSWGVLALIETMLILRDLLSSILQWYVFSTNISDLMLILII